MTGWKRRTTPRSASARPPRPAGRPTRLTPELQAQLVAAVRETGWLSPAARRCGVSETVVQEWIARGRGTHPRRLRTPAYARFADAIQKAQAEWEASKLTLIDTAARTKPECWTAAAW